MHSNNNIQNELKELNSLLAGVPVINVYKVPGGYFEASLLDIVNTVYPKPEIINNKGSVPEGYFEGLAGSIMNKIKEADEMPSFEELSPVLLPLKGINVYQVPLGYFESLADNILIDLKGEEPVAGYSSLLSSVQGINVFTVPDHYFESLAGDIVNKLPRPAKVIEMRKSVSIFRYAAAAVVSGIIGLSVVSVFNTKDLVEKNPSPSAVILAANDIIKTNSFDKVLSTISDADIVNYLQTSGEDVNAALVASLVEEKNLPEQADYLTDDQTLDNLLNGLNIDQSATN